MNKCFYERVLPTSYSCTSLTFSSSTSRTKRPSTSSVWEHLNKMTRMAYSLSRNLVFSIFNIHLSTTIFNRQGVTTLTQRGSRRGLYPSSFGGVNQPGHGNRLETSPGSVWMCKTYRFFRVSGLMIWNFAERALNYTGFVKLLWSHRTGCGPCLWPASPLFAWSRLRPCTPRTILASSRVPCK